uniref:Glycoprotein n=1 Tax=Strongyloides stercoralis TaxID=6248 RepID=A0A0K0EFX2_STRER
MINVWLLLIILFSSPINGLQICPFILKGGEKIDIKICRDISNGDIYWNETVKFIRVNFVEDYCESFFEDVYLSDSRLIRIRTKTMYMPSNVSQVPSCVPKNAVYLLNGLFYVPSQKEHRLTVYRSNHVANKLAMKICANYQKFVQSKGPRSMVEARSFIRQIYGSDNVTGYISSGIIYLLHCTPISNVDIIYTKSIKNYCYEKTPVIINNSIIMFTNNGIDLDNKSPGGTCEPVFLDNQTLLENNTFLKWIVVILGGMIILLITADIIGVIFLIKRSRKSVDDGGIYGDLFFKLVNESIRRAESSRTLFDEVGPERRWSPKLNVTPRGDGGNELRTFSFGRKKRDCIQFHEAPPRPHPFEVILGKRDSL